MREILFSDATSTVLHIYNGRDNSFESRLMFWAEQFGDKLVTDVTAKDVEHGIDVLANRPAMRYVKGQGLVETNKYLSGSSINRYVASLATMFKMMRAKRMLPYGFQSPTIRATRMPEGESRTIEVTVADVRKLVSVARFSPNRELSAFVALGCTTGLRRGNLTTLRWRDIDFEAGHVDVGRTKNGTPTRCALLPWVSDELLKMQPKHAAQDDPVFTIKNPMKAWRATLKEAGLPTHWTIHHMRHVAASALAQSGASTIQIMAVLNQKSPAMALRYSHLNTADKRQALEHAWGA